MLKITFALEGFFPDQKAGTEIYALNLARELRLNGHEVNFIIPYKESKYTADYDYDGFQVLTFPIKDHIDPVEANGLKLPSGINEFLAKVKASDPDIVHFHSFGRAINFYYLLAVKDLKIKTVFTPHLGGLFCTRGDLKYLGKEACSGKFDSKRCFTCFANTRINNLFFSDLLSSLYTPLQRTSLKALFPPSFQIIEHKRKELEALKLADAIVGLSPWICEMLQLNGIGYNVHLVRQGINPVFNDSVLRRDKATGNIVFGYVGRIHPIKGVKVLLDAFQSFGDAAQLKVITIAPTSGNEYHLAVKDAFSKLENIIWIENLSPEELLDEYRTMDVLCLPSQSEMAPLVVQEASGLGIPVIGSSIAAFKDVISHNVNGLLFESGSADDLLFQMRRIVNEPNLLSDLKRNLKPSRTFMEVGREMEVIYHTILDESQ